MMIRGMIIGVVVCLMLSAFYGAPTESWADDADRPWVSRIISIQGHVLVKRHGGNDWQPAGLDDTLFAGDQIQVEANSRSGIVLSNDAVLRLDQNTTLVFTEIERPATFIFKLLKGAVNFFSHRPRSLKIVTPFVNGVVEGTEFYVQVDAQQTRIDLFEGRILARNALGELQLSKGRGAVARAGQAPQSQILVHPRDSVHWALYYPPVLTVGPNGGPADFNESLALYNQRRLAEALDRMGAIAQKERNARFYTLRAGLLLNVGRVNQAREDIQQALTMDAANSDALALKAIIAVVQNRKDEALAVARKAVQSNPQSATAQIALSYAHQAAFSLPEALQDARTAVSNARGNGLAWSRLAELQLSTGELDQGIESAQKAAALNPRIAHAHTILGYSYLTRIKTQKAREAFSQAILLDSTAPLPRLGLGLAKIRDGDLEEGRAQIEIAAGIDPGNALIRSYLGKAYFDEKRGPRDEQQFEIAKNLDPKDPTPWFYDAIRKQTLNRPVEALQDLQKSIELNDSRAVYRSRLLLDEDLAARSAALGRIYNDLSFQEQALREGAKSLRSDPIDFSAHRLLSDIYASRSRHEIAQVSELLQSQLLQPLNITPLRPQLAESSLTVLEAAGAQRPSFNEFNPLFTRDRTTLQIGGTVGNNSTWSDEASLAGLYKPLSFSLGQYHYETDGFRPNNDLEKDISDVFAQAALSSNASLQFEYRHKDVSLGDLELRFDPEDYSDSKRVSREEEIPRLGFHYSSNVNHHFICSLIFNRTDFSRYQTITSGPYVATEDLVDEDEAYNVEGQYLYRSNAFNVITGAGFYDQDIKETATYSLTNSGVPVPIANSPPQFIEAYHTNAYTYAYLKSIKMLEITFGLSADDFKIGEIEARQLNPKFGFNWYLSPSISIRGAAFRSLKRALVTNQTVEPTQVAGFSQFFDDNTAADARRYGIGLDYQLPGRLACGVEMTYHDMSHPRSGTTIRIEKYSEFHHHLYAHWLMLPQVAVGAEYLFDDYERDPFPADGSRPYKLRTHSIPVSVAYFNSQGLFVKLRCTDIYQRIKLQNSSTLPAESKNDNFALVDLGIGYRLPKRYGVISFFVSNFFDTNFNFQDTNFLTASDQEPVFQPVRQYLLKAILRF